MTRLAFSAPAITVNQGSVNIAALNGNSLGTEFYWAVNGSATWHPEALPGLAPSQDTHTASHPARHRRGLAARPVS